MLPSPALRQGTVVRLGAAGGARSRRLPIERTPRLGYRAQRHAAELAESGSNDEVRSLLDDLAPDDFKAVGRGWLKLLAFANVAWAAITVDASCHATVLRGVLDDYTGQIAVMATGTHAMCAVIGCVRASRRWRARTAKRTTCSMRRSRRNEPCGPSHLRHARFIGGVGRSCVAARRPAGTS